MPGEHYSVPHFASHNSVQHEAKFAPCFTCCAYYLEQVMGLHSTGQKRDLLGLPLPLIHLHHSRHSTSFTHSPQLTSAIVATTDIPYRETLTTHTAHDHLYILPYMYDIATSS